jgi:hypothetical protein
MLEKGEQIVACDDSGRDEIIERRHGCMYRTRNVREGIEANENISSCFNGHDSLKKSKADEIAKNSNK